MIKDEKGFSIIELIMVISIMGILLLIGSNKYYGYTKKASLEQIKNDVKIVSGGIDNLLINNNELINTWDTISSNKFDELLINNKIYNFKGLCDVNSFYYDDFKIIPKDYLLQTVETYLKGTFICNKKGDVYYIDLNETGIEKIKNDLFEDNNKPNSNLESLKLINYSIPNGIYNVNDKLNGYINFKIIKTDNYKIVFELIHKKTSNKITYTQDYNLNKDEIKTMNFEHIIKSSDRVGFYDINIKVLDSNNNQVFNYISDKTIYFCNSYWEYFYNDDFNSVNKDVIGKIGSLNESNVNYTYIYNESEGVDYSKIDINIKANSNITGQVKTIIPVTYSTFEAKIKVPDNDSLLNGFFLYGDIVGNDIANEIDIEIYKKDESWIFMTTIYNPINKNYVYNPNWDPGVVFHKETTLQFNPSADFHNYKINFYPNYISFEVDDNIIDTWNGTFEYTNMYLYTGSFYTFWLKNNISQQDLQMNVEWIRRCYKNE